MKDKLTKLAREHQAKTGCSYTTSLEVVRARGDGRAADVHAFRAQLTPEELQQLAAMHTLFSDPIAQQRFREAAIATVAVVRDVVQAFRSQPGQRAIAKAVNDVSLVFGALSRIFGSKEQ